MDWKMQRLCHSSHKLLFFLTPLVSLLCSSNAQAQNVYFLNQMLHHFCRRADLPCTEELELKQRDYIIPVS